MKKTSLGKEILTCLLCLVLIASASGLLLGTVNQVTYVSPEAAIARSLNKYFEGEFNKVAETDYAKLFKGINGSEEFYVAMADGEGGYSGIVPMFVKFVEGEIVQVNAGTNQETMKAPFEDDFLNQYIGKNANNINGFSLNDETKNIIDAISGATKSSTAITDGVDKCVKIYKEEIGG